MNAAHFRRLHRRLQNASVLLGVIAAMTLTGYELNPVGTLLGAVLAGAGSYVFWVWADRVAGRLERAQQVRS